VAQIHPFVGGTRMIEGMDFEGVEGPMERGHRASLPQSLILRHCEAKRLL
jgi:hypothetical protein